MKEFIEKLIGRLEERIKSHNEKAQSYVNRALPTLAIDTVAKRNEVEEIKEIVNQLAEEYGKDTNVTTNDFCEWQADDKEIDVYYTKCGQAHIFIDGNPEENNHVYCAYCGKKIKVVE